MMSARTTSSHRHEQQQQQQQQQQLTKREEEDDDVILTIHDGLGLVTLNRPNVMHALHLDMVEAMYSALVSWSSPRSSVQAVLISSRPGRDENQGERGKNKGKKVAFCAGADVKCIVQCGMRGDVAYGMSFFRREYLLDGLISKYPKPCVSILDGVVMGGGVGISIHGTFRIATEHTVFAMPECPIGLFPDVGGSYFLSRMPGGLGMYLGLTGARLEGVDVYEAGVATHYLPSSLVPAAVDAISSALLAIPRHDTGAAAAAERCIGDILFRYQCMNALPTGSLEDVRDCIDGLFDMASSVEEVFDRCRRGSFSTQRFSREALGLLQKYVCVCPRAGGVMIRFFFIVTIIIMMQVFPPFSQNNIRAIT